MNTAFKNLCNEDITVFNENNEPILSTKVNFQKNKITIFDVSVVITDNCIIERQLANGLIESYTITNIECRNAFHMIPAHYDIDVEKVNSKTRKNNTKSLVFKDTVINVNGQLNMASDNNTFTHSSSFEVFTQLEELIKSKIQDNSEMLLALNEMKEALGKPTIKEKYNAFIQSVASHITVVAPFIPALTKFL